MFFYSQIKRFALGESLPTSAHAEERLSRGAALAVLSSDALSSVAYATEEILLVLVAAGSAALSWSVPIAATIVLLLGIVVLSYRQTIRAYPKGGGSYIVARDNLGLIPGLIAGASLAIDYILTVTVSVSAGTAALTSAVPELRSWTIPLCLVFVFLLMVANLRGVRESGKLFAIPTYTFIVSIFVLLGIGFYKQATGYIPLNYPPIPVKESVSLFFILNAFSRGCTALTGVEAISDGILAFKPPEWKNARVTLLYMGIILGIMFLGITLLARAYHIVPTEGQTETVVSLLAREILSDRNPFYYFIQVATLSILLLAANTSFADFPRLCYFLARDGFLPRQLALLGDRLVYSNGIIILSLCAAVLIVIFQAKVSAIIPLYAVGVFASFTLSQAGMVRRWFKERTWGWRASALMNGIGAISTSVVLCVLLTTKFLEGAWLVVLLIPLLVILFLKIHRHYLKVAEALSIKGTNPWNYISKGKECGAISPAVVVVGQLNLGTLQALGYASSIASEIVAVHVDAGTTASKKLEKQWQELDLNIPLVILDSPYRSVIDPIVDFIKNFEEKYPDALTTVIIPSFVTRNWWEGILHNQTAVFLKAALRNNKSRVVTTIRYYL